MRSKNVILVRVHFMWVWTVKSGIVGEQKKQSDSIIIKIEPWNKSS